MNTRFLTIAAWACTVSACGAVSSDGLWVQGPAQVVVSGTSEWRVADGCVGSGLNSPSFCTKDAVSNVAVTFDPPGVVEWVGNASHDDEPGVERLLLDALAQGTTRATFSGTIDGREYTELVVIEVVRPDGVSGHFCDGAPVLNVSGDLPLWFKPLYRGQELNTYEYYNAGDPMVVWSPASAFEAAELPYIRPTGESGFFRFTVAFLEGWEYPVEVVASSDITRVRVATQTKAFAEFPDDPAQAPQFKLEPEFLRADDVLCARYPEMTWTSKTPQTCLPHERFNGPAAQITDVMDPNIYALAPGICELEVRVGEHTSTIQIELTQLP